MATLPEDWQPEQPVIEDGDRWIWRAWWRLHADRPWRGGGMGPAIPARIPWSAVVEWCLFHEYGGQAVAVMDGCFAAMDAEFFAFHTARCKAQEA